MGVNREHLVHWASGLVETDGASLEVVYLDALPPAFLGVTIEGTVNDGRRESRALTDARWVSQRAANWEPVPYSTVADEQVPSCLWHLWDNKLADPALVLVRHDVWRPGQKLVSVETWRLFIRQHDYETQGQRQECRNRVLSTKDRHRLVALGVDPDFADEMAEKTCRGQSVYGLFAARNALRQYSGNARLALRGLGHVTRENWEEINTWLTGHDVPPAAYQEMLAARVWAMRQFVNHPQKWSSRLPGAKAPAKRQAKTNHATSGPADESALAALAARFAPSHRR